MEKEKDMQEPQTDVVVEQEPIIEVEGGEAPKVIGLRERMIARGKKLYPEDYKDDDYDDDAYEAMAARLMDDMDERDERLLKLSDGSKALFDIFQKNPETFEVFSKLRDGAELPDALIEVYGEEAMSPNKDGDFWKKFREDKENKRKRDDELRINLENSDKERRAYYESAGMSEEDINAFEEAENALYTSMAEGKVGRDYFENLRKALNYDGDVSAAHKQGEVDGKNSKIKNELRKQVGDGLPHFDNEGGKNETKEEKRKESGAEKLFKGIAAKATQSKWD